MALISDQIAQHTQHGLKMRGQGINVSWRLTPCLYCDDIPVVDPVLCRLSSLLLVDLPGRCLCQLDLTQSLDAAGSVWIMLLSTSSTPFMNQARSDFCALVFRS